MLVHSFDPQLFDLAVEFWSTGDLIIEENRALKFGIPDQGAPADLVLTNAGRAMIGMMDLAVSLNDRPLFDAALQLLRNRMATNPVNKLEVILGLQKFSVVRNMPWNNTSWDAEARRVLLSALVKIGEVITPADVGLDPELGDFQAGFIRLYIDYCRGRIYYKKKFDKWGPWRNSQH